MAVTVRLGTKANPVGVGEVEVSDREHPVYLTIVGKDGKILSTFVIVSNGMVYKE